MRHRGPTTFEDRECLEKVLFFSIHLSRNRDCKARPFATEKDFTTIIDLQFGSTETGIINDSELIANLPFYCSIVSGN